MSNHWPRVPLREVLTPLNRSETVQPDITYRILGAHWYAEGLYTKEVKPGSEIRATRLYRVEEGDFVYNRLFAWKGSFAIATNNNHGCHVSNEFPCFTVKRDRTDRQYLRRYFSRASAWDEALGLSTGGTPTSRNRLKEEKLLAMVIPLPPLAEQRRIVARIESLAAKLEVANGLCEETAEEGQALINATRRSVIGDSPKGGWKPLHFFVKEIVNGKSPACEGRAANEGEWGVLKVGAVSFGYFEPKENKALPLSFRLPEQFEVKSGDFLMSRANTAELVGACTVVRETKGRLMLSDKILRFNFRNEQTLLPDYLNHVMKSPALREQIIRGATGTSPTMKNISKEKVFNLLIPNHPLPEQRRIVAYLDGLQGKVNELKKLQAETAAELDALLPSILDKAFKGEL